jgi:hypothetical protein
VLRQPEVQAEAQTPSLSATLVSGAQDFFAKSKKLTKSSLPIFFFAKAIPTPAEGAGAASEEQVSRYAFLLALLANCCILQLRAAGELPSNA